jgi:hypothetical protein
MQGITDGVFIDGLPILGWIAYPLPLDKIDEISSKLLLHKQPSKQDTILREFRLQPGICFLDL